MSSWPLSTNLDWSENVKIIILSLKNHQIYCTHKHFVLYFSHTEMIECNRIEFYLCRAPGLWSKTNTEQEPSTHKVRGGLEEHLTF